MGVLIRPCRWLCPYSRSTKSTAPTQAFAERNMNNHLSSRSTAESEKGFVNEWGTEQMTQFIDYIDAAIYLLPIMLSVAYLLTFAARVIR